MGETMFLPLSRRSSQLTFPLRKSQAGVQHEIDLLLHPRMPPLVRSLPHVETISLFRAEESQEELDTRHMLGLRTADDSACPPFSDTASTLHPPPVLLGDRRQTDGTPDIPAAGTFATTSVSSDNAPHRIPPTQIPETSGPVPPSYSRTADIMMQSEEHPQAEHSVSQGYRTDPSLPAPLASVSKPSNSPPTQTPVIPLPSIPSGTQLTVTLPVDEDDEDEPMPTINMESDSDSE